MCWQSKPRPGWRLTSPQAKSNWLPRRDKEGICTSFQSNGKQPKTTASQTHIFGNKLKLKSSSKVVVWYHNFQWLCNDWNYFLKQWMYFFVLF
jgi:hypothetical protein